MAQASEISSHDKKMRVSHTFNDMGAYKNINVMVTKEDVDQ